MSLFNNTINLNQIPVNVYGFIVTLLDAEDKPIQNATITGIDKVVTNDNDTNGSRELTSDENGQIKFFTNTGTVNITGATGLPGDLSSEDFKGTLRGYINKTVNYILGPNSTSNKYKYQITCKYKDGSLVKNTNVYASMDDYISNRPMGTTNNSGVYTSNWVSNDKLHVFYPDKDNKLYYVDTDISGKLADTQYSTLSSFSQVFTGTLGNKQYVRFNGFSHDALVWSVDGRNITVEIKEYCKGPDFANWASYKSPGTLATKINNTLTRYNAYLAALMTTQVVDGFAAKAYVVSTQEVDALGITKEERIAFFKNFSSSTRMPTFTRSKSGGTFYYYDYDTGVQMNREINTDAGDNLTYEVWCEFKLSV